MGEKLSARLGTSVVFENQTTGGGVAAAKTVQTAAPDGHTLALFSNATAVSVALFNKLPYDPLTDFMPIAGMSEFGYVFLGNYNGPNKSLPDVLAAARAKPGALNFGTAPAGTSPYLTALLFKKAAGIDFTIVPFRGATDLTTALIRNDVDVVINAYGAVKAALEAHQLRAFATTALTRAKNLPDVPTVAEAGIANFEVASWNGLFAPAGTPKEVVDRLYREVDTVLCDPEMTRRFLELGVETRPTPPDAVAARLRDEIARWSKVIDEAGIPRQ